MARAMLLSEAFPEVAEDLRQLLREEEPDLSEQVASLVITEPCGCGDDFCASFYTGPRPSDSGSAREGIYQTVAGGEFVFAASLVDGRVYYIEILSRPEIKTKLDSIF